MLSSRSSLKRRRLKDRFGIRADRVAVYGHVPWYWYACGAVFAVIFGALLLLGFQVLSGQKNEHEELLMLRQKVLSMNTEIERLNSQMGTAPNALLMAETTQKALSDQLQKAQTELIKLKEELAYCQQIGRRDAGIRKAPIHVPGAGTIPANPATNPQ